LNKQLKYGSAFAYINIILNLAINFLLTPFLLRCLGSSEYGVYKIVQSFTGQLAIMSFGLATVTARYVVLFNTKKQKKEKENFLFMIYSVACILAVAVVIIGFILYFSMDAIYASSLNGDELQIAKRLCVVLVFNIAFSILCDAFTGIIRAYERFIISNVLSTVRLVLRLCSIIVLLNLGVKSIGVVLTDLSITVLILLFSILYGRINLREKARYYYFDGILLKECATFALAVFLQAIVNQVNQNLDNTILGIMTSTAVVTVYSIALTLYTCFISLVTALSGMFGPRATKLVAQGATGEELTNFVVALGRIQTMVALLGILGFIVVGKDFIYIWMGDGFEDVYKITIILIIPAIIPLIESVTNTILDAMMKRMARSIALLGMCAINVLSSIIFIKMFGYIGAAFGTALSVIVGHGIIINLYLHKKIGLNIPRMFKTIFKGILPAFMICLLVAWFIIQIPSGGIITFLVKSIAVILLYGSVMFIVGMNNQEKAYILNIKKRE
jgi:O-antigen/teichoic acid export membrane protein